MGTAAQWLYVVPIIFFIEWSAVVFEISVPPFWSQSFRFAQTDGTRFFLIFFFGGYVIVLSCDIPGGGQGSTQHKSQKVMKKDPLIFQMWH